MGTRCAATIIIAVLAGLCMGSVARTVRFTERILTYSSEASRTPAMFRPSTAPAVKLIIEMDAEGQRAESRRLFGLYPYPYAYPHPRLLFYYPSYVPHVGQHSRYWAAIHYVPPLRGDGSYVDPREISDIGWYRALSRVPGVVIR